MEEEYKEITLADLVATIGRRKFVLASVFLLVVVGGVSYTVFTTPQYESTTTLVPLAHADIIKNWLDSRQAAELVADDLGDPVVSKFFPDRWDAGRSAWRGEAPTREQAGAAIAGATRVSYNPEADQPDRFLSLTVRTTDPLVARDVADAFVATLDILRPELEDITQQEAFDRYYDGSNQQEAQQRAEVTARQMDYWLVLDRANTPGGPVSPNVTLNIALTVVLALMLSIFAVFFWEWMSNYRAERKKVEVPPAPEAPPAERRRRY